MSVLRDENAQGVSSGANNIRLFYNVKDKALGFQLGNLNFTVCLFGEGRVCDLNKWRFPSLHS